jgi:ABC-type uncharacterized transport system permease subunit
MGQHSFFAIENLDPVIKGVVNILATGFTVVNLRIYLRKGLQILQNIQCQLSHQHTIFKSKICKNNARAYYYRLLPNPVLHK